MSKNNIILDIDGRRFVCPSGAEAAKIADSIRKLQPLKWEYDGEQSYYIPDPDFRIEITYNGTVEKTLRPQKVKEPVEPPASVEEPVPASDPLDLESSTNREG